MSVLVLGGGGSRGAWQAGALRAIQGMTPSGWSAIYGTSVGALNGAGVSQRPSSQAKDAVEDLVARWVSLRGTGDVLGNRPGDVVAALAAGSLWTTDPLKARVEEWVRADTMVIPLRVGVTDMRHGNHLSILLNQLSVQSQVQWIMASASFPLAMPSIQVNGTGYYRDGGLRRVVMLEDALDDGAADSIDVVLCTPPDEEVSAFYGEFGPPAHDLLRCVEILASRGRETLDAAYRKWRTMTTPPTVRVWWPSFVPTDDPMSFDQSAVWRAIEQGHRDAMRGPREVWK